MTKNRKSVAAFALAAAIVGGGTNIARAQNASQFTALPSSETPINVRVPRGERVTLSGDATRIIAANDDVARGLFSDGRPVLEGVATGTTLVEVYGRDNSRRLYSVQVEEPLTTTRNSAKTAISQIPPAKTRAASKPRFAANNEAPQAGAVVTPVAPGTAKVVTPDTPTVIAAAPISALPNNNSDASTRETPNVARSGLVVSMRVAPSGDNPMQALCTITYRNGGSASSRGVMAASGPGRFGFLCQRHRDRQAELRCLGARIELESRRTGAQPDRTRYVSPRTDRPQAGAVPGRRDHRRRERRFDSFQRGQLLVHFGAAADGVRVARPLSGGSHRHRFARCERPGKPARHRPPANDGRR